MDADTCSESIHNDGGLGLTRLQRASPAASAGTVNSTSPPLSKKLTCFGLYALGATKPVRVWTTHWANAETTNQMLGALRASYHDRCLLLV